VEIDELMVHAVERVLMIDVSQWQNRDRKILLFTPSA
jgi:hypothetical protein